MIQADMGVFADLSETRRLGSPILAVFRTALGRDPSIHELTEGVRRLRAGAGLPELAAHVAALPEFEHRHGRATDAGFVAALCRDALGVEAAAPGALAMGQALEATRPGFVAAIAAIGLARGTIPMLPGLAPGAPPDDPVAYQLWVAAYDRPDPADAPATRDGPCIAIAMVAGDTQAEAVAATIASLRAQHHGNWRLHLAARTVSPWAEETIARLCAQEERVVRVARDQLWQSWLGPDGALACVLGPGDRLPPMALAAIVQVFAAHPDTALVYTDEDVAEGGTRHSPRFKPAHSPGRGDAIGQLAVYRPALLAGRAEELLQPDALAGLAASLAEPRRIRHRPGVLCHRAAPPPPPGAAPRPPLPEPPPLVTVVVPTRDRAGLLEACARGVLDRTDYPSLELLIVDNGSAEPDAVALLATLAQDPRVRVLPWPGPFNFAAMCNAAAAAARGDILLLLNNDTETTHPDWLAELVAQAARPGVGVVGARLLYPSGTIQHAGLLLGPGGRATHVGRHAAATDPGYLGQLACVRDFSAVTGACLAIPAAVWRQVGGMDERLAVTWNDVDLCLRVRRAGLRVVWTPHATLLHREAATRGHEAESAARVARFEAEQALVLETWGDAVARDPFLNPNLVATEAGPLCLAAPRPGPADGAGGLPD